MSSISIKMTAGLSKLVSKSLTCNIEAQETIKQSYAYNT
jgi:hypothetical protein